GDLPPAHHHPDRPGARHRLLQHPRRGVAVDQGPARGATAQDAAPDDLVVSRRRGGARRALATLVLAGIGAAFAASAARSAAPAPGTITPTLDQIVSLRRVATPVISPDGRWVAYTVRDTDWVSNAFVTQVWLADTRTGDGRPLTQGKKNSNAPAWAPDGRRLAFGSERTEKRQVFVLDMAGGDAVQLTSADEGVTGFSWSPDGNAVAYVARDPRPKILKEREQQDGEIEWAGEDHRMSHLWT